MRIGVIGSGAMATALGGAWARAGHDVLVGGRDPGAASRAAAAAGGGTRNGTPADAAESGEAVLVAVPADAARRVVGELAAELAGRTLLDCTVPMAPGPDGPVVTTAGGPDSVAAQLAAAAPGARVAKVFGICHESIWTLDRPSFCGAPLAVPFCTDDPAAAALVTGLVSSMGCTPLPCGGLARAGLLESAAVLAIGIWRSGGEARHVFPAPALAPGAVDDEQL
ncbi:NADPH-dependent F420 reductase [Kitasatospora hibisci]|uniref:NADPH-dependent F420 reductase n=1 Tax=Kitasatospora hibisci TaxID=3369522 RepID=UPI00375461C3